MTHSRTFRLLFVGSLLSASAGVIVFSAWLLLPEWQKYRAVDALVQEVRKKNAYSKGGEIGEYRRFVSPDTGYEGTGEEYVREIQKHHGGDLAVWCLTPLLKDADDEVVWNDVWAISDFRPRGGQAFRALAETASHRNASVRAALAHAVGDMYSGDPDAARRILLSLLDDESSVVRRTAAWQLSQARRHPELVAVRLQKALTDNDKLVQVEAAYSLWLVDPASRIIAVSTLNELASGDDRDSARSARMHLGIIERLGPPPAPAD